jgi:hypothetical protein
MGFGVVLTSLKLTKNVGLTPMPRSSWKNRSSFNCNKKYEQVETLESRGM